MEILFIFFGLLFGGLGVYIFLKPKMTSVQNIDKNIIEQNKNMQIELDNLNKEYKYISNQKEQALLELEGLEEKINKSSEELYKKASSLANEKMNHAAEVLSNNFQRIKQELEQEYCVLLQEHSQNFQIEIKSKEKELTQISEKIEDLAKKYYAAIEANKRSEEQQMKIDYYKLQLSQLDIEEISKLRKVGETLREKEPLNKVIWKVYYEKPYTDLINRVIGAGIHCGIYKITNIKNQKSYVGQAVDIASRWKQHIKRGIGAETPTKNKLYPAMIEIGVENFSFEVIEECDKNKLNEREQFWQEYFHAKDFGYSIK